MNENNNEKNGQIVPAQATEPMAQPIADEATTAEIPGDATLEMPPVAADGTAAEAPETPGETVPREPWYRKITQSGGATAAVAAGALVVIGLVSGLSACAGAHLGSADDPRDHRGGVERLMEDRAQAPSRGGEGYGCESDGDDAFDSYGYGRGQGGGDLADEYDGNGPSDGADSERGHGRERGGERGFAAPNGDEDKSADEQSSDGDQSDSATDDTDRQDDRRNRKDQQRPDEGQDAQNPERFQAPQSEATA